MNVDPRGFYINEQGVVAPKQTVFNGGKLSQSKRRKTRRNRKNKKSTRKATRRDNRRS